MKIDDFKNNAYSYRNVICFVASLIRKNYIELKFNNNFDRALEEFIPIIKDAYYKTGDKIILSNDFLRTLLLEKEDNSQSYFKLKKKKKLEELCNYLDLENFDYGILDFSNNQNMIDLMINYGISFDPQKVKFKIISDLSLNGTHINGHFDDVGIMRTNFSGSKGAVINPQTVYLKNLAYANLKDTVLVDDFDDVLTCGTKFDGAKFISKQDYKEWLKYYNYLSCAEKDSYFEELRDFGYDCENSKYAKKLLKKQ